MRPRSCTQGVGAVVHQLPVSLLDNICLHLPTIGGWIHHAAFDLAVAGVVVPPVQTSSSWLLSSPLQQESGPHGQK
jgi:hypothetical protein